MQVMVERCCGLDVHQETVVACVLIGAPGFRPKKEVRTFRTMTRDLEALRDWLKAVGVTHVGMESTGVYWRPVYAVLEGYFELIVGNGCPATITQCNRSWHLALRCHATARKVVVSAHASPSETLEPRIVLLRQQDPSRSEFRSPAPPIYDNVLYHMS